MFNEDNVGYDPARGCWVAYDNSPATAQSIKDLFPYEPVAMYDRETGQYTPYKIKIKHQKPQMNKGKLIYEVEEIEV